MNTLACWLWTLGVDHSVACLGSPHHMPPGKAWFCWSCITAYKLLLVINASLVMLCYPWVSFYATALLSAHVRKGCCTTVLFYHFCFKICVPVICFYCTCCVVLQLLLFVEMLHNFCVCKDINCFFCNKKAHMLFFTIFKNIQ